MIIHCGSTVKFNIMDKKWLLKWFVCDHSKKPIWDRSMRARRVTKSIIFIYLTLFYILTSVLFRFWYNSVDMVCCRALTFSPLENELCIGSKLVVLNKNKQIKCSEIIKFTSPTTQPSDSPNLSQTWLPLSSII